MVHQGQRLALSLEAGDDGLRIHPYFDDLERHAAAHGRLLFRHPDGAEATFADSFDQNVASDPVAGLLLRRRIPPSDQCHGQDAFRLGVAREEVLHPRAQRPVTVALPVEDRRVIRGWAITGGVKDVRFATQVGVGIQLSIYLNANF